MAVTVVTITGLKLFWAVYLYTGAVPMNYLKTSKMNYKYLVKVFCRRYTFFIEIQCVSFHCLVFYYLLQSWNAFMGPLENSDRLANCHTTQTISLTTVKIKYQLDKFNKPPWVSFGHCYVSFRKCPPGMPCILWKNISKFVFENSRLQIADAFQLWYRRYFFEINRKRATGNFMMFMLLHWYCHRGFGCGKIITFNLKISTFSVTYTHTMGPSHFCQRDASA